MVMPRNPRSLRHRIRFGSAPVLPLCLLLSACGGGGGDGVASTPPPPPAPPTSTAAPTIDVKTSWLPSPATSVGDSGSLIGRLTLTPGNGDPSSSRVVAPGDFSITSAQPRADGAFKYTLNASAGILPGGLTSVSASSGEISWDINLPPSRSYRYNNPYGDSIQYVGQRLTAFSKASDGSETQFLSYDLTRGSTGFSQPLAPDRNLRTTLDYDIGYSYVAMGEWSWRVVDLNGTAAGDFGDLLFVEGDHTPQQGIPASGTATYDARSLALLSSSGTPGIPFTLTADFGLRTMAARIDQDYRYDPSRSLSDDPILGIHVAGSAPFSNDGNNNTNFDIPLTGTANYSAFNSPSTPAAEAVSGIMNGSLFGPHAEQVGGVFGLGRPDGTLLMQDAFVGQQRLP
jgi:hypothetical protein